MATATHLGGHATSSNKLEDQAASAALYVTRDSGSGKASHSVLDEDGKLSSAGAATSLKYARAQDLPSFPSAGLQMSSAGAAASLADSNKKSFEHWKPGEIPAANRAAMLAKDYEMDPLWKPEMSAAGSKAALLAHRDTKDVEIWKSHGTPEGQSAAGKALKIKAPNAITERNVGADGRHKALLAATGAMSSSRKRADSAPVKPDDKSWALKAATSSQRGAPKIGAFTVGDPGFEAARIQNIAKKNVNRQMYGSSPPVAIEVEEKNRQDTLRASAVAMAQKMYAIQQSHIDEAAGLRRSDSHAAANSARQRAMSNNSATIGEDTVVPPRYENLEEAARKLAQERLSKLHDEHAEYRDYYGQAGSPRSRLSVRLRRRASSGAQTDISDEEQSRQIRSQMSLFHSKLQDVDSKKRQADRDAVLVAAQKNVEARMAAMDDRVFQETGKASPQQRELWEKAARERAQKDSDERMQYMGKVHIGGGKYLEQSEVEAIARARLQPTFDDINEKAEQQRARDAEIRAKAEEVRLDQERAKADAAKEKARQAEVKAELKAANDREKAELKTQKLEEKRVQKEQANAEKERLRLEKEEKRKSRDGKGAQSTLVSGRGTAPRTDLGTETALESTTTPAAVTVLDGDTVHDQVTVPERMPESTTGVAPDSTAILVENDVVAPEAGAFNTNLDENTTSSSKADSKVRSWLKTKFAGNPKASKATDEGLTTSTTTEPKVVKSSETDAVTASSIKDVALAGRTTSNDTEEMYDGPSTGARANRSPSISSVDSTYSDGAENQRTMHDPTESDAEQRGRKGFKQRLLNKMSSQKEKGKASQQVEEPAASLTDDDQFEEARDTFEEERLKPPAVISSGKNSSPHGSRERSKFTEDL